MTGMCRADPEVAIRLKDGYEYKWRDICQNCYFFNDSAHFWSKCCGHDRSIGSRSFLKDGLCRYFVYEKDEDYKKEQSVESIPYDTIMGWCEIMKKEDDIE